MLIMLCVGCNFDDGLCSGWSQNYQDDLDWTKGKGPTLTYNTGPSAGYGGDGESLVLLFSRLFKMADPVKSYDAI